MAEISIDNITVLCSKSEGRDKLARFFQYGARALVGFANLAGIKQGTMLSRWEGHCRTAMTNLAGARRTHRWCKELPVILSIPQSLSIGDPFDCFLDVFTKVTLSTFFIIDHIGHLKQWKILPGGKRNGAGTVQLGLKFFCLSNIAGAICQTKKYLKLSSSSEDKSKDKSACFQVWLKHVLLIVQTAHLSLLYTTHDSLVGILGMITSAMDVKGQWPPAKPAAPKALLASGSAPAENGKDKAAKAA
mmetsp:Transcript_31938/g.63347  ORF Transcript_31938/g.63347 Transcript_31938/m.63347 type:complete len:246 (+) Transcript_31938:85-822(+)